MHSPEYHTQNTMAKKGLFFYIYVIFSVELIRLIIMQQLSCFCAVNHIVTFSL